MGRFRTAIDANDFEGFKQLVDVTEDEYFSTNGKDKIFSYIIRWYCIDTYDFDIRKQMILYLCDRGIRPSGSRLYQAVQRKNIPMVEFLLTNGIDINYQTRDGWTALHWAAFDDSVEIVKLLLTYGANKFIKNTDGKTADQITGIKYKQEIITLISNYNSGLFSKRALR